jgi:ketosteroid isomerase-like protein
MRFALSLLCALQLPLSLVSAQEPKHNTDPLLDHSTEHQVWNGEQDYFRYLKTKDLKNFMALWDEDFVGWPDYTALPVRKREIRTSVAEEFQNPASTLPLLTKPSPEAITAFDDIALTFYFWPETDKTSATTSRIMHVWQNRKGSWHIIGGMDCEVPRPGQSVERATSSGNDKGSSPPSDEKIAVEGTVIGYEDALQTYDFGKANSFLAQDAKWIERSPPQTAASDGTEGGFWTKAKATKVRLRNEPHDFDVHVQENMAWVTLIVDVTTTADNEEARNLLARTETEETGKLSDPSQHEWRGTYVESEVLTKTPNGWKISLGHTSRLPEKIKNP